jgi:dTMP kinase
MEGSEDMVLVVIDGLDASGKSTQANALCDFLRGKRGKTVLVRFHPSSDSFFGARANRFLYESGKNAHFAAAFFYMFDVIRSILLYSWRKHDYVIFVRYLMGTAYLPSPLHSASYRFFAAVVPTSEFMFFLDVAPEEAFRRIQETRARREMFESLDELRRTRLKALTLASMGGWKIVDANETAEKVGQIIIQILCL